MFKATLTINDPELIKTLKAEKEWKKDRSSAKIKGKEIFIEAKDIIAFKATLNGIIKLIETYEKVSSVIK